MSCHCSVSCMCFPRYLFICIRFSTFKQIHFLLFITKMVKVCVFKKFFYFIYLFIYLSIYWFIYFNVYFLRQCERQSASSGGADRGRHRIGSGLQAPSCQPRAWCGAPTHEPRDHDLSRSRTLHRLSHSGALLFILLFEKYVSKFVLCVWLTHSVTVFSGGQHQDSASL